MREANAIPYYRDLTQEGDQHKLVPPLLLNSTLEKRQMCKVHEKPLQETQQCLKPAVLGYSTGLFNDALVNPSPLP